MAWFSKKKDSDYERRMIEIYGDLISDFVASVNQSSPEDLNHLQILERTFDRLASTPQHQRFQTNERAWVLQVAFAELETHSRKKPLITPSEQILMDTQLTAEERFNRLANYLGRLPLEERAAIILRDKLGLPYREISSILGAPEGSVKIRRQQALRTLEEWIWNRT